MSKNKSTSIFPPDSIPAKMLRDIQGLISPKNLKKNLNKKTLIKLLPLLIFAWLGNKMYCAYRIYGFTMEMMTGATKMLTNPLPSFNMKAKLFAKVRSGDVRVLIGSTQKMGAGTNVQNKLIALHDLDCPWRPADLTQRLGRMVRQGNENDKVDNFRYVTKGTFDAYLYQMVEKKQENIS